MKLYNLNYTINEGVSYDPIENTFSFNYQNDTTKDIIKLATPDSGTKNIREIPIHFGCKAIGKDSYITDQGEIKRLRAEIDTNKELLKRTKEAKKLNCTTE